MGAVQDLYDFLEAQGIAGGSTDWTLVRRKQTDAPASGATNAAGDQTVVIAEDGGTPPEQPAAEGVGDSALADEGVLITVRGRPNKGDDCATKAQEILTACHGQRGVTWPGSGGTYYHRVAALTPAPVFVGFDDRARPKHTVALRLLRDV